MKGVPWQVRGAVRLVTKEVNNGSYYFEPEQSVGVQMTLHGLA
jgi:hypothetical protein